MSGGAFTIAKDLRAPNCYANTKKGKNQTVFLFIQLKNFKPTGFRIDPKRQAFKLVLLGFTKQPC